jgi:hypothetical protein
MAPRIKYWRRASLRVNREEGPLRSPKLRGWWRRYRKKGLFAKITLKLIIVYNNQLIIVYNKKLIIVYNKQLIIVYNKQLIIVYNKQLIIVYNKQLILCTISN